MPFVLSEQRNIDVIKSFEKYNRYLESVKHRFPPSAFELAISQWYFDPNEHKCPHDAWLEECAIAEKSSGKRQEIRTVSLTMKLLGAYHDGHITFHYPRVFAYKLDSFSVEAGHRDWRFDEFRISHSGTLIHEIEWWGPKNNAQWLIEADDALFMWMPLSVLE